MSKVKKDFSGNRAATISGNEEAILIVLKSNKREMYGLEIFNCLNSARGKTIGIDFGYSTLYPALKRLAKEGLITWRWGDDKDTGGGRRKYFQIAPLGINSLEKISSFRQELSQIYLE